MKKMFKKSFLLFPIISLFFSFTAIPETKAANETELMLAPEIFELQLEKGQVYEDKIKIYNKSTHSIPLEAIISNFDTEDISGTAIFREENQEETEDTNSNPSKWIKIENPNLILEPEETTNLKFSISVPENVEDGGYYTAIFFEPKVLDTASNGNNVSVVTKIGTPFMIMIGDKKTTDDILTITEFRIPENLRLGKLENFAENYNLVSVAEAEGIDTFSIVGSGALEFNLNIKNNDRYHIKPSGTIKIMSASGKLINNTEIRKTTILPGKTRNIPIEFDSIGNSIFLGKYIAILELEMDDTVKKEEIEFYVFPWRFLTFLALFIGIIILLRKRIKKSIMVLIKKNK